MLMGVALWAVLEANSTPFRAKSAGAPVFSSSSTVNDDENSAIGNVVIDVDTNAEVEGAVSYVILSDAPWTTNGPDHAAFTIDASTGLLRWAIVPNFESPVDTSLGGTNTYFVYVRATDTTVGDLATNEKLITVTVTDVNEAP
jgi:hypothetical protein